MDHEAINNVRRKINEVMKKTDERIVVGWRPSMQDRKEGEVWEGPDGKQWTVKNGIIQNITKLDSAKTPFWCPQCSKPMNHRLDVKFWNKKGKCMDCVIVEETKIRKEGRWVEYEKSVMKANFIAELKDTIKELEHVYETVSAPEIVHADDTRILMIEKWHVDIEQVKEDIKNDLEKLRAKLIEVESENENGNA